MSVVREALDVERRTALYFRRRKHAGVSGGLPIAPAQSTA
jgi:hypothetical protein